MLWMSHIVIANIKRAGKREEFLRHRTVTRLKTGPPESKLKLPASYRTKPSLLWCQLINNGFDEDDIPPINSFRADSGLFGAEFMSL